jgi:hypothetical protein
MKYMLLRAVVLAHYLILCVRCRTGRWRTPLQLLPQTSKNVELGTIVVKRWRLSLYSKQKYRIHPSRIYRYVGE